nr:MAG TPA: DNA helix destabilizing protein [Bacteriophage sp.]
MSDTVVTGQVRFSFVHIFQPHAGQDGQEEKYSISLLIPKSDVTTIQALEAAMNVAAQEGVSTKFGGQMPPMLKKPLYDGDGTQPNGGPFGEECHGCMVLRASSKQRPEVVDANLQAILNPAEVYSGCYGRVSLRFFPYNQNGNRGIGCGLNNVQKLADGEPLTAKTSAKEDFAAMAPAPGAVQPGSMPAYQAPQAATQGAPVQQGAPMQQGYPATGVPQPDAAPQGPINPVTGLPMGGGVMGL